MKRKIIKITAVTLFSGALLLLLGSMPINKKISEKQEPCELNNINKSLDCAVNVDFSVLKQKNPLILLEFSVE